MEGSLKISKNTPKNVTVWGVCNWRGESLLFFTKPHRYGPRRDGLKYICWGLSAADFKGGVAEMRGSVSQLELREPDLFPKNKPQKYTLTPVKDELEETLEVYD